MKKFVKLIEQLSFYDDDDIEVVSVTDVLFAFNEIKNLIDEKLHKEFTKDELIDELKTILK